MTIAFGLTYDYRCPFARNAHEHVVAGLRSGADWQVEFVPFSLSQVHVEEEGIAVWDDPRRHGDLLALEVSVVVRDKFPDRFLDVHEALFAARHDHALDLREESVVSQVLEDQGVDSVAVFETLTSGVARDQVKTSHERAVSEHQVFGVPTFIVGDQAAFVRIMTRPGRDSAGALSTIERVLALVSEHADLNEVKHTTVSN